MLTNAALVWWKRTHLTTVKKQFGYIQRITCLGMTGCMSTTPTTTMETFLGLPPLQLVVEKETRQAAYRLHCSNHFKKSDWGHSAIFKMATKDFSVLMALSDSICYLWRYLIGNIWWNIPLGRYDYLMLKHGLFNKTKKSGPESN
jgi:hypothetical protein